MWKVIECLSNVPSKHMRLEVTGVGWAGQDWTGLGGKSKMAAVAWCSAKINEHQRQKKQCECQRMPTNIRSTPYTPRIHPKSISNPQKIYRTSIENLSNIYRTSIEHLSNIYRTSIEHRLKIYRTSIEHLSNIYRTSRYLSGIFCYMKLILLILLTIRGRCSSLAV